MAQQGPSDDPVREATAGAGATNGTGSGVILSSTAGRPSQVDDVPSQQRPDESRVPVRNAPGTATVGVGGARWLPTVSGQPRQTVRGRDRQASFLGGAEDDESSFLASAGESEYTVIDRAPNSVDRYQLYDTPIGGSQRLSEEALRRHNEVMSPDFGRMRAMGQDAIRSVSQASSRRTTASIVELRNQLERNHQVTMQNQQAAEQNQRAVENKLEQSQRMMEQMMNMLTRQQQGAGAPALDVAPQPTAAIAAPARDRSPPRPPTLSPPILTSVSDYQQIRRRTPVDTAFNDQFARRTVEQMRELSRGSTPPPIAVAPDHSNRAATRQLPEMGPAFEPIRNFSPYFSDIESSDRVTHRRPNPVGPVEREVHRPRAIAPVTEARIPARDREIFTERRSVEREGLDEDVYIDPRPPSRTNARKRSKSAHEMTSRRTRARSYSSDWGSVEAIRGSGRRYPRPQHRSPGSDKTHNRNVSRKRRYYDSFSRSPDRGEVRETVGRRFHRPSLHSPTRDNYCNQGGRRYDSDGAERRGNPRGSNHRSYSKDDVHSDPGRRPRRSSPGSDLYRRDRRDDEYNENPPPRRDPPKVETEPVDRVVRPVSIARREWIKCDKYDGTVALDIFLCQFYTCAEYNGWTEVDKLAQLKAALKGRAAQILLGCAGVTLSFTELVAKLQAQFGTAEQSAQFRIQLRMRRRARGESLQDLYLDVSRLVTLAYPGPRTELGDSLAVEAFIDSLDDGEFEEKMLGRGPKDLDAAFKIALQLESQQRGRRSTDHQRGGGRAQPRNTNVISATTSDSDIIQEMRRLLEAADKRHDQRLQETSSI